MSNFKAAIQAIMSSDVPNMYVEAQGMGSHNKGEILALAAAVSALGGYNEFDGPRVGKWIREHKDIIWKVRFGREYSVVMYITPVPFHLEKPRTKAQEKKLVKDMIDAGSIMLSAEESHLVNPQTLEVRYWWD